VVSSIKWCERTGGFVGNELRKPANPNGGDAKDRPTAGTVAKRAPSMFPPATIRVAVESIAAFTLRKSSC
jgi:hypothetical protein